MKKIHETDEDYDYDALNPEFRDKVEAMTKEGKKAPEILHALIVRYMTPICDQVAKFTNARLTAEYSRFFII